MIVVSAAESKRAGTEWPLIVAEITNLDPRSSVRGNDRESIFSAASTQLEITPNAANAKNLQILPMTTRAHVMADNSYC